ncbi:MAG: hypothetical protein O2899_01500 [Bacteroidetes bacterium]|nr:hypothetical protein [Bacteroidota bacterium]
MLLLLTGCSPRLSPLYRDYEVTAAAPAGADEERAVILDTIREGLEDAGWTVKDAVTDNVVATESRAFRQWGVYAIEVDLEVAPVGGDYVRLLVHPYRIYFTGAKRKIPYLRASLARSVLKELHASMEERGLKHIGTAQTRDRQALRRN